MLGLLSRGVATKDVPTLSDVGRCSAAAWALFFEAEACALEIDARLPAAERSAFPIEIQATLTAAVQHELKRALAARGQLKAIAKLARQASIPVAVLKGGVPLAKGKNLHLLDIDLLVPPEHGEALTSALESAGYQTAGWSSPRHLAARVVEGGLRVEIHTSTHRDGTPLDVSVWDRLAPLEGELGLWRLPPEEHLWHLLVHLTVDHPYRAGRIRDLLVLADAVGACSQDDLAKVERRCNESARRKEAVALLATSRRLQRGELREDDFVEIALANYTILTVTRPLRLPSALYETVLKWTFAFLAGPEARREVWSDTVSTTLAPSPNRIVAAVERRFPRIGRGSRMSLRLFRLALALALAVPIAALARFSMDEVKSARLPSLSGSSQRRAGTPPTQEVKTSRPSGSQAGSPSLPGLFVSCTNACVAIRYSQISASPLRFETKATSPPFGCQAGSTSASSPMISSAG